MTYHSIETLERDLRAGDADLLDSTRLAAIRQRGRRRRTARQGLTAVGSVVVVGVLVLGASLLPQAPGTGGGDADVASDIERPTELTKLQKRVLAEVPGAEQVSLWQVRIPVPAGARSSLGDSPISKDFEIEGEVVSTGAPMYAGVTAYARSAFPRWLWDEVQRIERVELGSEEEGYPVGSTDMGILVEAGETELACVAFRGDRCQPSVLRNVDGRRSVAYGFGTDDFLEPGTGMEVFAGDAQPGDAPTFAVAGLPSTEVASVEFVNTAGETVEGGVAVDTLADGATIVWAEVAGSLQRVTAYDADGDVVDDHELRPCSGGVDCEVR